MKKISILLPVFNEEKNIEACIQSILESSYSHYEIIIINDGSTDQTINIIERIKDSRIKLYNKQNTGLVETLNYGIKKCNNEIIMRMDADDLIHSSKIKNQLTEFIHKDILLLGTEGRIIDDQGEKMRRVDLPLEHNVIINSMLNYNSGIIHPSIMVYKEALHKVKGYSEKIKHAEDHDLFLRLSKIGKIANLGQELIYLRKHSKNVSHKYAEEQISNTIIANKYYESNNCKPISKDTYLQIKKEVLDSIVNRSFIKAHKKIVELQYLTKNSIKTKILFFKVIRKLLKQLI